MSKLSVLILDFDGVIVESNQVKTDAFIHVFGRFPEYTETMMAFHYANVSLTRFSKFEHLLKLMGKTNDNDLKANISKDFSRHVLEGMMKVPLVSGAIRFLQMITSRIPVYLASVTPEKELILILKQRELLHWFRGVYGCPPWTKTNAINDILSKEGFKPEQALLIGDSAGDQRAAKACGIEFFARDSGLNFDLPLPQMFQDMNEIANYINNQFL